MIIPNDVTTQFELAKPYVLKVAQQVRDQVFAYCEKEGFAFIGRTKSPESVTEKLESGRFKGWNELDDLYACTVIIPTLSYETNVLEHLATLYEKVRVVLRGSTQKDPAIFRFDATRFVGKLRADAPLAEDSPLRKVKFEVQICSAFEHAWSVATHALAYKASQIDWKRLRLAAQLKASVEQLDLLTARFDVLMPEVPEHVWPDVAAMKHIESSFRQLLEDRVLPEEVAPDSWSRFCENVWKIIVGSNEHLPNNQKLERAKNIMGVISDAARALGEAKHPRSLSLIQFTLGTLTQSGHIKKPIKTYVPLITKELIVISPEVMVLGEGFQFD